MEEEVKLELKPLSDNAFKAFFQKIYRKWMGVWYGFKTRHTKLADLIYTVFFFIVFSMSVTVWQYIVMTFLPYAFTGLGTESWGVTLFSITLGGEAHSVYIFGDESGLGYFVAYEIAVFTAQCINFPLQRNITYRSHGNPWWQAMWYFIGWVVISVIMNLIWGIVNCFLLYWGWADAVIGLIKTIITGGVSMVVFFFIFLVIFPNVDKDEKSKKAKAEKKLAVYEADAANESKKAAYEKAQAAYKKAERTRIVYHAEGAIREANSLAEAKISTYLAVKRNAEKGKATAEDEDNARKAAIEAVISRDNIVPEQQALLDSVA
ncbi:MAG: hypothetical protein LUD19_00100 [Clostridia bacterium]|nr:hypothetical protein [Clostridia bacterium]